MKYYRLDPLATKNSSLVARSWLEAPEDLTSKLRKGDSIVLASWDQASENGIVLALGVVIDQSKVRTMAEVLWRPVEITLRPNPQGRRWWTQPKPWFAFADNVIARYTLADLFAEHFPDLGDVIFPASIPAALGVKPTSYRSYSSSTPTPGFVYVIRSEYGFKIGKTINLRDRTRLFAVKLPFAISIEHYAWFDDYSQAERSFHITYQSKRLEGEWFDLNADDLAEIKTYGEKVDIPGLLAAGVMPEQLKM